MFYLVFSVLEMFDYSFSSRKSINKNLLNTVCSIKALIFYTLQKTNVSSKLLQNSYYKLKNLQLWHIIFHYFLKLFFYN